MSIYSFTRLADLSSSYISTRTYNVCVKGNMHTVNDVWDYYQRYRRFRGITNIGKKGEQQLMRIVKKVNEVSSVMPLTLGAVAPMYKPGFSLPAFYASLDETGRKVAENFFRRFANRLRVTGLNMLEKQYGDVTLSAVVKTKLAEANQPKKRRTSAKGSLREVSDMMYALATFFQSELWNGYAANLGMTLLRQQIHGLMGGIDHGMDTFLKYQYDKIGLPTFSLSAFIDAVAVATTFLHPGVKSRIRKTQTACQRGEANAGKLWEELKKTNAPAILRLAIELLEHHGFRLPLHYQLPDRPYHTGDASDTITYRGFGNVFVLLLYNPNYGVARYKSDHGSSPLLVMEELLSSFDFTGLLKEVDALKNATIYEDYSIDLFTLMAPYFLEEGTVDEDILTDITANLIRDVYGLTTNANGELELKRTSKRQTWEFIVDILAKKQYACSVTEILNELDKMGVVVTRATVRQNLNGEKVFAQTTTGNYCLRTQQPEQVVSTPGDESVMTVVS